VGVLPGCVVRRRGYDPKKKKWGVQGVRGNGIEGKRGGDRQQEEEKEKRLGGQRTIRTVTC